MAAREEEAASRLAAAARLRREAMGAFRLSLAVDKDDTVAKGGIKLLTQGMAAEWAASGIQANAIGPGYMLTDMNEALVANKDFDNWVKSRTPAGRWGQPEELVGTAIFLASSASDYVNGQIIYVDGGMLSVL